MKTLSGARVYELRKKIDFETGEATFHAQTHCVCGSTMSSGEWWSTTKMAVDSARENIEDHVRIHKCESPR